jgi:hypothetical protein
MLLIRFAAIAIYFAGALLLVLGHSLVDLRPIADVDTPTLGVPDSPAYVPTVWAPPEETFELIPWQGGERRLFALCSDEEGFVRPAWLAFAAVVVFFLVLWTNTEHVPQPFTLFWPDWITS